MIHIPLGLDLQRIHQSEKTSHETTHLVSSREGFDAGWQFGWRGNDEDSLFRVGCGCPAMLLDGF